ncbi:uncharacterized protein LOC141526517 [Cotesia typhae]|uniref:uncharacterized protein LOC141526517 n=1 Tax=Cotesia typhae TaxID=2053667 RepID=UPI003D699775
MAAKMLNFDSLKKSLIEDVKLENSWSDTDNDGNDAEVDELLGKFVELSHSMSDISKGSNDFQPAVDNIVNSDTNNENCSTEPRNSIDESFLLFFDEKLLTDIVNCTNSHIDAVRQYFSRERDCQNTELHEIKVFIGLIILAGLLKCNLKLNDLWEKGGIGAEVFRLSISLRRFKFLLRYVNFTNPSKTKQIDKVHHKSDFVDIIGAFKKNCEKNFELGPEITISRKYLTFKSKLDKPLTKNTRFSSFIVYFIMDSNYGYVSNLEFYDKKRFDDKIKQFSLHHGAVIDLLESRNEGITFMIDESCEQFDTLQSDWNSSVHQKVENTHGFTTEEILSKYSMIGHANRLLLKLLFFMIDIACLNSFVIEHTAKNYTLSRKEYLKQLGLALVKNQITMRSACPQLSRELRDKAANYLSLKPEFKTFDKKKNKPIRCIVCPRNADKKVRSYCGKCERPMCQIHLILLCSECASIS